MMASSQRYTQAAVLRLNLSKNHNYITCFGIDLVDEITRIERSEDVSFLFEDADFSIATIRKLIKQKKALRKLWQKKKKLIPSFYGMHNDEYELSVSNVHEAAARCPLTVPR
jgi:hypothetical protein